MQSTANAMHLQSTGKGHMKKAIPWILGVLLVVSNLAWLVWTIDTAITRAYDGSYEI